MKRAAMLFAVVLCLWAWAASDATIAPSSVKSVAPAVAGSEAITIPQMLSYQGKLTDTAGMPVADTTYSVMFRLYTVPMGGSSFWNETQMVRTRGGLFSTLLGSVTPIGTLPDAGTLYLGMAVAGGAEMTPRLRIASAAYAYKADTANYSLASAGGDNAWVRGTPDSVLYTVRQLGIARGGSGNLLYGSLRQTHTNLGVACMTGTSGQNYGYATVGGGWSNGAWDQYATVGGGQMNDASDYQATVGGGYGNTASGYTATVGGGENNNSSSAYATVGGGQYNDASGFQTTVGGGGQNIASGYYATVGGGVGNIASLYYATVAGGSLDSSAGNSSFTTNYNSVVPDGFDNSAAFNGQRATATNQTRVGVLSKASGTFTIDHPLDPHGKILNHYFIEGPEMLNIYRGSVVLDGSGLAVVTLPDYFDALNRNPMVQLTGVGSSDVYVAEKTSGNRFTIGGRPGTEVYWQVTGERKDVSAEITRRLMPVEQPKTGVLAGTMLDDDFLRGAMDQLVREGKAQGIDFRTAAGRQRYERMKQHLREAGQQ